MRPIRFPFALLRRLWRNDRGNFAMMLGLMALPLMGFIGLATDVTRAYMAKVQLQGACDTAALAAATLISQGASETTIKDVASKYFYSNYSQNYWAPPAAPVVTISGQNVTVSATSTQTNFFVRLFGQNTFDIAANSSALAAGKGMEVAMVLDVTGSMNYPSSKLQALKDASSGLVNVMFGDKTTSNLLKIGIVPFSASVHLDPAAAVAGGWIDTNGTSTVARLNFDTSYANNYAYALYKTPSGNGYMSNTSWAGCVEARPNKLEETDTAPAAGTPDSRWVPFMAPDNPDNVPILTVKLATTANVTLTNQRNVDGVMTTSNTRVLVKNQSNARNNGIYVTPNANGAWVRATDADTALELNHAQVLVTNGNTNANSNWSQTANVVTIGTSTVTFTKQAPLSEAFPNNYLADVTNGGVGTPAVQALKRQKYTAKYQGKTPSTAYGSGSASVNRQCVPSQIMALTNTKAPLLTMIDGLTAEGNTHIPLGIGWGWRLLSPTEPYTQAKPYTDNNWTKVLIIETDGANTMPNGSSTINQSDYTAYGFADQQRLGAGVNTAAAVVTEMNNSMKRVCDNIKAVKKADGKPAILIYTIGFGDEAKDAGNEALLKGCASGVDNYFYAPTNAELEAVFAQIAQELNQIRLTK